MCRGVTGDKNAKQKQDIILTTPPQNTIKRWCCEGVAFFNPPIPVLHYEGICNESPD
jgi:hypothetical protein